MLALVEGNSWGWGSPEIIALFALSVVSFVGFVLLEPRVREPMVDFNFFRSKTFLGSNIVAFIVTFSMLATFFFIALYMQNILGYSAVEAGVRFLPSTLMIVLIAPLAGRLTDRVGPRPLMVAGLSLATLSLFLQTRIDVDTGYEPAAAGLHPAGHRHGARDVADVDRGDERRRARTRRAWPPGSCR